MAYRTFLRITAGDTGKPVGKVGLGPIAKAINGHIAARAEDIGMARFEPARVYTSHGFPGILIDVDSAEQARVAVRTARVFLQNTGWTFRGDHNSAMQRALISGGIGSYGTR